MKIMKQLGVIMVAVLMLLGGTALPAVADSRGILTGHITGQAVYYWQGSINRIDLSFDTGDGLTWTLRCRRANANLGLCSNPTMDEYVAEGTFSSNTTLELESMTH